MYHVILNHEGTKAQIFLCLGAFVVKIQAKGILTMRCFEPLPPEVEIVATAVVDSAYKIHRALGPGLIESVYELCLVHELRKRGFEVRTQLDLPIRYDDITIKSGLRPDILVADVLIVEVKAVEQLHPVHQAQVLTYLKLMNRRLGLLINFNVAVISKGIKRIIL